MGITEMGDFRLGHCDKIDKLFQTIMKIGRMLFVWLS